MKTKLKIMLGTKRRESELMIDTDNQGAKSSNDLKNLSSTKILQLSSETPLSRYLAGSLPNSPHALCKNSEVNSSLLKGMMHFRQNSYVKSPELQNKYTNYNPFERSSQNKSCISTKSKFIFSHQKNSVESKNSFESQTPTIIRFKEALESPRSPKYLRETTNNFSKYTIKGFRSREKLPRGNIPITMNKSGISNISIPRTISPITPSPPTFVPTSPISRCTTYNSSQQEPEIKPLVMRDKLRKMVDRFQVIAKVETQMLNAKKDAKAVKALKKSLQRQRINIYNQEELKKIKAFLEEEKSRKARDLYSRALYYTHEEIIDRYKDRNTLLLNSRGKSGISSPSLLSAIQHKKPPNNRHLPIYSRSHLFTMDSSQSRQNARISENKKNDPGSINFDPDLNKLFTDKMHRIKGKVQKKVADNKQIIENTQCIFDELQNEQFLNIDGKSSNTMNTENIKNLSINVEESDERLFFELIRSDKVEELRVLLNRNPSLATRNFRYQTGLHLAARKGFMNSAKILFHFGADPIARDILGRTPKQLAVQNKHQRIIDYYIMKYNNL